MSTPPPPPPRGSSEVTTRKTQQWRRVEFSEEHQHSSSFQSSRTVFERGEVKQNFSSSATKQSVASRTSSKSLVTFSSGAPGAGGGGKPIARVSPVSMFEDRGNVERSPEKPILKPKPSQSEIVQIRINSFTTNPRHPVPQPSVSSCSTFIDSAVFNSRPVAENKADCPPPSQQSLVQSNSDRREEKKSSIESLNLIDSSSKQQASLFESVPSVEYKRLDETEKSQNDSLDDISVSLNNDPIRSQGQVSPKDGDTGRPEDQALSFIDEDPNVIPEAQGNLSSLDAKEGSPPSSGLIGEARTTEPLVVCDECVNAGHLENGNILADTTPVVTKETVSDINQNVQIEKQHPQEQESLNNVLEAAETTVSDPEAESSAKTDTRPGERPTPVTDISEGERPIPVTDGGNQEEQRVVRREEDPAAPEEERGLVSAQQPLMSSKLSVTSIQSGESLGSFSFSADSLDVDNIEVEDGCGGRRPEAKRLTQEPGARPGAKETTEASTGGPQTSAPSASETNGLKAKSEENQIQYFSDGHYWCEIDPINSSSAEDENVPDSEIYYKPPTRIKFSREPIRQFTTYSCEDYDRRNEELDPVAASAEYELEKRVERMEAFEVEITKGDEGLGLSIIGMGVGADCGLEKLGIFVKTVTVGGAADRDGRIRVNDQILEVDGESLVGVTQSWAAAVLRNTSGLVKFVIGRDRDPYNSEVAHLIHLATANQEEEGEEHAEDMSWLDYEQNGANTHLSDKLAQQSQSDVSNGSTNNKDIVNVLKLQLEEAQDHNHMIQDEMIKLKSQWEMLAREREDKLQSELQQRLVEATERLELEDKVEASWREIKRYQDTLAQSQEQLQSAQLMIEESHDRSVATHEKYVSVKRMLRKYEILYRLVTSQLQQRDESYKNYIKSLLSHNVVHTLPSLHRILKKQPYVPAVTDVPKAHSDGEETELDAVKKTDNIKRSSAAKHKIDLHKRKRNKRKKPSLPLYFELTAFEASLLQLQQKLAQSVGPVNETNLKVAHAGTQTMFSPTPTSGESQSTSQDFPDSGNKNKSSGAREPLGSVEASAEVRRQRRRTATRDRRTEESRHEVRREAEAVTAPEVKNRFLTEALAEASSVKTSRTADTVTFVEVEAEANERRGGKGDSAWKFDKRRHSSYCPSHNRSKSPGPSRHHSQYYPDYHPDPEPQRSRDPGDEAQVTPGPTRKHADNCHRSHRGSGGQEPVLGGGEPREHRHHRRRHHKHRQMSGGDQGQGEAGAELSVPVTSYQTVESGLYSVDVEYGYNYTRVEPSQHIGVFPLQFPATKGAQLGSGYPETEYSRENVRESSRDLSRAGRERLRELRERERQEVPEVKNRFIGEEQCECRNCQAERKYERKRRKKAEKISWN